MYTLILCKYDLKLRKLIDQSNNLSLIKQMFYVYSYQNLFHNGFAIAKESQPRRKYLISLSKTPY